MSSISDMPNPFKMLDLERQKKTKSIDGNCNECVDKNIEGMASEIIINNRDILFVSTITFMSTLFIAICILGEWIPIEIITNFNVINVKWVIIILMIFIAFSYIPLWFHRNKFGKNTDQQFVDKNDKLKHPYIWIPILVGFVMFLMRFIPGTSDTSALIGYFENTIGHFMFLIKSAYHGGMNNWIRSDNFEALTIKNGDRVSNNFNPLMSIFNLNNYEQIIKDQMRTESEKIINEQTPTKSDNNFHYVSDFFISLEHNDGKKTKEDFIEYVKKETILKRVIGELTLLITTTLISTGLLKMVYT
jgi:positive regulator of sigma E activity